MSSSSNSANTFSTVSGQQLPSRYVIRKLNTPEYLRWTAAVVSHSNTYRGPIFSKLYPGNQAKRFSDCLQLTEKWLAHSATCDLSYGVFDKEYKYRTAEAERKGGEFFWDGNYEGMTEAEIIATMDFPLVSVAMAFDGFYAPPTDAMNDMIKAFPIFVDIYTVVDKLDNTKLVPKRPGQLLRRNATSTRTDYEGQKLMKFLAHHQIREAAKQGWEGIQMDALNPAVTHVWAHPPAPFTGGLIDSLNICDIKKVGEDGKETRPYADIDTKFSRCFISLKKGE